jgi:hypothetical protein
MYGGGLQSTKLMQVCKMCMWGIASPHLSIFPLSHYHISESAPSGLLVLVGCEGPRRHGWRCERVVHLFPVEYVWLVEVEGMCMTFWIHSGVVDSGLEECQGSHMGYGVLTVYHCLLVVQRCWF